MLPSISKLALCMEVPIPTADPLAVSTVPPTPAWREDVAVIIPALIVPTPDKEYWLEINCPSTSNTPFGEVNPIPNQPAVVTPISSVPPESWIFSTLDVVVVPTPTVRSASGVVVPIPTKISISAAVWIPTLAPDPVKLPVHFESVGTLLK